MERRLRAPVLRASARSAIAPSAGSAKCRPSPSEAKRRTYLGKRRESAERRGGGSGDCGAGGCEAEARRLWAGWLTRGPSGLGWRRLAARRGGALLEQRVARRGEHVCELRGAERVELGQHGEAADEFGEEAEGDEVVHCAGVAEGWVGG